MYVNMVHLQPLCSHMQPLYIHFLAFWTPRGPSRTPKTYERRCIVIEKQGFAEPQKVQLRGNFLQPFVQLLGSFWTLLGSQALSWASLGAPKGAQCLRFCKFNEALMFEDRAMNFMFWGRRGGFISVPCCAFWFSEVFCCATWSYVLCFVVLSFA